MKNQTPEQFAQSLRVRKADAETYASMLQKSAQMRADELFDRSAFPERVTDVSESFTGCVYFVIDAATERDAAPLYYLLYAAPLWEMEESKQQQMPIEIMQDGSSNSDVFVIPTDIRGNAFYADLAVWERSVTMLLTLVCDNLDAIAADTPESPSAMLIAVRRACEAMRKLSPHFSDVHDIGILRETVVTLEHDVQYLEGELEEQGITPRDP